MVTRSEGDQRWRICSKIGHPGPPSNVICPSLNFRATVSQPLISSFPEASMGISGTSTIFFGIHSAGMPSSVSLELYFSVP